MIKSMGQRFLILLVFLILSFDSIAQIPFVENRKYVTLENWKFSKGVIFNAQSSKFNDEKWEDVNIPHTYSMDAINEIGYYRGTAWYRTKLQIPETMTNERLFLRFEGVGQEATLFLNGENIGTHIGGYSAFCFEISSKFNPNQENYLAVKVSNAPNYKRIPVTDALFNHYGGIYRPVQLFSTPKTNITPTFHASSGVFIETKEINKKEAKIEARIHLSSTQKVENATLKYTIKDEENKVVSTSTLPLNFSDKTIIKETITISNPILWNGRKNAHQYTMNVIVENDNEKDEVDQKFGIRNYKIDPENGFILNQKPYRLYGVAMHQEWKQVGPALTPEHHQRDMELVDEIGATSLRLSHYQHSDATYRQADSLGLLVWTEIPYVHDYSGREANNAKAQLTELILQNYNHPSVFVWGLWNEVRAWSNKEEPCVTLTKELNELAHELDPTRITTSASDRTMEAPMTNLSDIQAWNKYYGWYYGEYEDMGKWLDQERKEYPEVALGISEYGVGGNIYQQDSKLLEKPSGNVFPEPVQTHYHEVTWKIIQDRPFVWGSFIWNLFDFSVAGWNRGGIKNLNHKGLITYDRKIKKDAFYFYKANWSNEAVLHITESRIRHRQEMLQDIKVFTNAEKVTLFQNGKKIATQKQESDLSTIVFKNIKLEKGDNSIEVKAKINNEIMNQKTIITLD